ncbi:MAG TPA: maleylpyruvate isomerase N-terminal domain-containing protein [Pseudonocardiaceae bacterium]
MTESTTTVDFRPAAHQLTTLLGRVTDDQLSARTPCEDYTVGDLIDHLLGLTVAFRKAATKSTGDDGPAPAAQPGEASEANPHREWRRRLPLQLNELVVAWQAPASWDGMTEVGGIPLSGALAGVPDGAPTLDRLLALAGREPSWTP